ncbi:MAG TPA: hypothetical protein PK004_04295, partial [Smithella sp.]|nr:hypothetical protein [Smithella sp.]HOX98749.1 hypothetical protein [Smithella sp.]HPN87234.1 hypothetical protein [Smithella sp.]HQP40648.1 hypothetical protein [Smithella sp.]
MRKIFAIFISLFFIASLTLAVTGCSKIEEDSANLQKAAAELKAQAEAKKAEAEMKAQADAQQAEADLKAQAEAMKAEAELKAKEMAKKATVKVKQVKKDVEKVAN